MWKIWLIRNDLVHNKSILDWEKSNLQIINMFNDFIGRKMVEGTQSRNVDLRRSITTSTTDTMTLITNASWNPNINRGGVGWILYDHQMTIIQAGQNSITNEWPISILEAKAIFDGLTAIQGDGGKIQIFSVCLAVINMLNNHSTTNLELGQLIHDIHSVARLWSSVSFLHVNRSIVHIADKLARRAANSGVCNLWNCESSVDLYSLFY